MLRRNIEHRTMMMMVTLAVMTSISSSSSLISADHESSGIFADDEDLFSFSTLDDDILWMMEGKQSHDHSPSSIRIDEDVSLVKQQPDLHETIEKDRHHHRKFNSVGMIQKKRDEKNGKNRQKNLRKKSEKNSKNNRKAHRELKSDEYLSSPRTIDKEILEDTQDITAHDLNNEAISPATNSDRQNFNNPQTTTTTTTTEVEEQSCVNQCSQAINSIQLSVQPSRQLILQGSNIQLTCHVTTGRWVTAVVGWEFESTAGCTPVQEDGGVLSQPPSSGCKPTSVNNERLSVNQTTVMSQLSLSSVTLKASGNYRCVVSVNCCRYSTANNSTTLKDSAATYIHVYQHAASYGQMAIIVAVCTCTMAGLLASAALMKNCVRRKISRRLSAMSYEAVRVYSQDPIFTAAPHSNSATDNNSEWPYGQINTCPSHIDGLSSYNARANIYQNPLDVQFEVPLTPTSNK